MSAEWVVLSPRHVDAADVVTAAAGVDPDVGIRQLWDGDALQLVAPDGVVLLTLFQSRRLERATDAARLLGTPLSGGADPLWWTSVHAAALPPHGATAERILRAIAGGTGGSATPRARPGR